VTTLARALAGALVAVAVAVATAGCGGTGHGARASTGGEAATSPRASRMATLALRSSAIAPGARIPARYTCDGPDISPPLTWTAPPPGTREQLVSMVDLDAPQPPFVHWALAGLASGLHDLGAGRSPAGATAGANGFGGVGYRGPCPPRGSAPHRYLIEVDALDQTFALAPGFDLRSQSPELASHTVARGQLIGLYR